MPNDTAWASDEHILPVGSCEKSASKNGEGGIVVAQEVSVRSELGQMADERDSSPNSGHLRGDDWALRNMTSVGGKTPLDRV